MCDQDHSEKELLELDAQGKITRRQFGALLGAGVVMMLPQVQNPVAVTESEVTIKTPDGTCDAYFVHPTTGTAPGVLVWPDIFGLRPAFRDMGKRLAQSGYSVLVVNPFYREQKAPTAPDGAKTAIAGLLPLMNRFVMDPKLQISDALAYIVWLDQQASVAKNRKIGTQGYCMGGPIALRTAGTVPDRVGAAASFHGAQLAGTAPDSPNVMAAKTKAQFLIAISEPDDMARPAEKTVLKDTLGAAAEIEVYTGAQHGWCPPDSGVYNKDLAEKAWTKLLALYKKALV
jgi:carboxymethylenebutenolidase